MCAPIPGQPHKDAIGRIARKAEVLRQSLAEAAQVRQDAQFKGAGSTAALMLIDDRFIIQIIAAGKRLSGNGIARKPFSIPPLWACIQAVAGPF